VGHVAFTPQILSFLQLASRTWSHMATSPLCLGRRYWRLWARPSPGGQAPEASRFRCVTMALLSAPEPWPHLLRERSHLVGVWELSSGYNSSGSLITTGSSQESPHAHTPAHAELSRPGPVSSRDRPRRRRVAAPDGHLATELSTHAARPGRPPLVPR